MTATPDILAQALSTFMEESHDLLGQMEQILLRADAGNSTPDDLNALFRCAHTIKGSGSLFGLHEVERFTHVLENVLDRLRNGELRFDANLISLLLDAQGHITSQIDAVASKSATDSARGDALIERLQAALNPAASPAPPPPPAAPKAGEPARATAHPSSSPSSTVSVWHVSLRFGRSVLLNGTDPLAFISYLGSLGTAMQVQTIDDALPALSALDPEQCFLGFEIDLASEASQAEIEGVFDFVRDNATIEVTRVVPADDRPAVPTDVSAVTRDEKRPADARFVKVPADRLDALIDRVGELVIAGAGTQQLVGQMRHPALNESAELLLALVEDIRDMALGLRMVTIGEVFSRFPRVVRDVSRELGKDIALQISGAECELDKMMVDKIADPLMQDRKSVV